MKADLKGKVVVITGASSGFGKGAALRFADEGARLVLAARRADLLGELARECEARGAHALACPADVSVREDVERLASAVIAACGRIDVWINNAGVGAIGRFERIPLEVHEQVVKTDLLGTLYGSYCAYRQFIAQGEGILINVASELGFGTVPYYGAYAAAKHGVVGLGDSLRQELRQNEAKKIHVCTVMPTAHDTPFFDHAANYTGRQIEPPRPLHDPDAVVETLVRLAMGPENEEIVGADGIVKLLMKKVAPGVQEKATASYIHRTQMEKAPPAPDSSGAVRQPMREGTEVRAGRA